MFSSMAFHPWAIYISLLVSSLYLVSAHSHVHGNPADELVDIINKNRTAHKSSTLYDNPGLGCMALQYIEAYNGTCDESKSPPEVDITEVFAPDCGVELPTVQTISGTLLACRSQYAKPPEAFSQVLIESKKSLSVLYDGNHTEVGVGVSGTNGDGPYFWCVLFGSGQPNSTFELEGGEALKQRQGCFSGSGVPCSAASMSKVLWSFKGLMVLVAVTVTSCLFL